MTEILIFYKYFNTALNLTAYIFCPNAYANPIMAMEPQQCLPFSVVQLKSKHCQRPIPIMGVADAVMHYLNNIGLLQLLSGRQLYKNTKLLTLEEQIDKYSILILFLST